MRAFLLAALAMILVAGLIWFRLLPARDQITCLITGETNLCQALRQPPNVRSDLAEHYFSGLFDYELVAATDFDTISPRRDDGCTFVLVRVVVAHDTAPPTPQPGGFGGIWRATPVKSKGWVVDPLLTCITTYPDDLWFIEEPVKRSGGWFARDAEGTELHLFLPAYQLAAVLRVGK